MSLWSQVILRLEAGVFCWNVEIAKELESIDLGGLGDYLKRHRKRCCLEVGIGDWPWQDYVQLLDDWRLRFRGFLSEYNGNRKGTINNNDLSIVALAKTLKLPVVSMEKRNTNKGPPSSAKLRIPDLCDRERVTHLFFNDFLKKEGIRV